MTCIHARSSPCTPEMWQAGMRTSGLAELAERAAVAGEAAAPDGGALQLLRWQGRVGGASVCWACRGQWVWRGHQAQEAPLAACLTAQAALQEGPEAADSPCGKTTGVGCTPGPRACLAAPDAGWHEEARCGLEPVVT
jgi:hypothetical protein